MSILVTDFGTSAVKSFLYDVETGQIIATAEVETPVASPEPGAYETSAASWLDGLVRTVRELVEGHPEHRVEALAITNQQISCVLLDAHGEPVHSALLWADSRSSEVLAAERARIAEPGTDTVAGEAFEEWFSKRVGIPYSDRWGVAKALWLRDSHPEAFARATRIASVDAYIALALTGNYVTDVSNATFFNLDITTGEFNEEVLGRFGIGPEYFADVVAPGSIVGQIRPEMLASLGLTGDVPLIISGSDQPCSMVGAGAAETGDVVINLGSGSFVLTSMAEPITDTRIMTNFSVREAHWVAMGTHYLTGTAFRWLRDILGLKGSVSYEELDAAASAVPAGSDGLIFIPSLTGSGTPDWRSDARGVMAGLSIEHGPGHLARAVMESTGYGLKLILETFAQLGIPAERIFLSGGATVSPCWSQTITDVLGRPVHLPDSRQATARGAFLLALTGLGAHADVREAVAAYANVGTVLHPEPAAVATYERSYDDYLYWKDAENRFRSSLERTTPGAAH